MGDFEVKVGVVKFATEIEVWAGVEMGDFVQMLDKHGCKAVLLDATGPNGNPIFKVFTDLRADLIEYLEETGYETEEQDITMHIE